MGTNGGTHGQDNPDNVKQYTNSFNCLVERPTSKGRKGDCGARLSESRLRNVGVFSLGKDAQRQACGRSHPDGYRLDLLQTGVARGHRIRGQAIRALSVTRDYPTSCLSARGLEGTLQGG